MKIDWKIFDDDSLWRWPKNAKGAPKLFVPDSVADQAIAAGIATEDDFIRTKPMPVKK